MAWLIMLLVWVAVTVLVGYPHVEKIEKLRGNREQFFPILRLRSGVLIAGLAEKVLKKKKKIRENYDESHSSFFNYRDVE